MKSDRPVDTLAERIMLFEVPPGRQLTPAQRAGDECVWCQATRPEQALAELAGGVDGFRPHSCGACREARALVQLTYQAWDHHASGCAACTTDGACDQADLLRLQHLEARQQAGKEPVLCAHCLREVSWAEQSRPLVWMGNSGPHLAFVHTGACSERKQRQLGGAQ